MDDLHRKPLDELLSILESDPHTGLSTAKAAQRLEENGKNIITPPKKKGLFSRARKKILGPSIKEGFAKMVAPEAKVLRDSNTIFIPVEELVIGDIIHLMTGQLSHVDVRIIECEGEMQASNPFDSDIPFDCSVECTSNNIKETKNIIFRSALITQSSGKGIVIATGDQTMIATTPLNE